MKVFLLAGFMITTIFSLCGQGNNSFNPSFKESKRTTHKILKDQSYTFGYLKVLENRKDKNSQVISLPIYIFKSRSENPKLDPIIYTVGGPGSTTMPSAQYMKFYKYLDDRDFILVEQRGNYYAKPHLDCPEWSTAMFQSNLPNTENKDGAKLLVEAAKTCRDRLIKNGIDLDGYNTNEIVADINDLVNVLDIEEYNLLTISYSTKIAQVLLRDYPERIRSVVMDSALPLEVSYDEESATNLMESMANLLADCKLDSLCNSAYPNLQKRFYSYLRDKTNNPLVVDVMNPITKKNEVFYLQGKSLINVYSNVKSRDVPYEINKLLNNDLSTVKDQLVSLFEKRGDGSGIGMRLSVWCAEEHPFNFDDKIEMETKKYPEISGFSPVTFDAEVCNIWNVKSVKAIENEPIQTDVPVLLISGTYDEVTPMKWAQQMNDRLENSHHLLFEGWNHTVTTNWENQCAMIAANDFFNNPNIKPNPTCLESIKKPVFKLVE